MALGDCKGCVLLFSFLVEDETLSEINRKIVTGGLHYFGSCTKADSVFSQAREIVDDVQLEMLSCDIKIDDEIRDYDPMQTGAPRGFKLAISSENADVVDFFGQAVYHPYFSDIVLPLQDLISKDKVFLLKAL
eukprot:346730-Hanusia_phi.AAC.2